MKSTSTHPMVVGGGGGGGEGEGRLGGALNLLEKPAGTWLDLPETHWKTTCRGDAEMWGACWGAHGTGQETVTDGNC